jgi:hypothetical protein
MPLPLLSPMLASTGQPAGDPERWAWEVKWDGWRALVYIDGTLGVRTRTGRQVSASLPELEGLADALDGRTARWAATTPPFRSSRSTYSTSTARISLAARCSNGSGSWTSRG